MPKSTNSRKSYEDPKEVVRWYYSNQQRLAEMEAYVVEANVVDFVPSALAVTDKEVSFEELASAFAQAWCEMLQRRAGFVGATARTPFFVLCAHVAFCMARFTQRRTASCTDRALEYARHHTGSVPG